LIVKLVYGNDSKNSVENICRLLYNLKNDYKKD